MSSSEGDETMKTMASKDNYERLQKDVDAVKNDISALTDQITEALNNFSGQAQKQAKRSYRQARSNAEGMVSDLGRQGSAALEAAQDAANSLEESIEDAIQQRPLAAVGLAIGLGFLVGITWRR
jgi:ElaB/YqjD/DUF883 family membrane-anchored ribosome-binding protein